MSSSNRQSGVAPIQSGIGAGFLQRLLGGKSFMHCVIELVKNCRDWGATLIVIMTNERNVLKIVDNGDGMDKANRNAFASINLTTAKGPRQAGLFCTGTKQTLFSQSEKVQVRTAPKEEPDYVYIFGFTAREYEELVLRGGTIQPKRVRKTAQSWPYEHPFGTEIVYTLRNPGRRGIYRGAKLAAELSARLPKKFAEIIRVDGEPLPPKQIIGSAFRTVIQHRQLGEVAIELYRPEKRRREEDLRLTAVEIGEVPMSNLNRVLGDLGRELPAIYLLSEVCGTISAAVFKDHANEDRFTFDAAIADDPRIRHFIRILTDIAPEVQRRLKIDVKGTAGEEGAERDIKELANRFTAVYGKDGAPPPALQSERESDGGWDESSSSGGSSRPAIRLSYSREFEVGELIEISVRIRKDLASRYSPSDIEWYTDRARATNLKRTDTGITMRASELGHGVIYADIPGSPISARAHYDVVGTRIFKITVPSANIMLGSRLPIMTANHDRVAGEVRWELEGVGELEPQGKRALYHANREGVAVVTAYDSQCPSVRATCDVSVRGKPRNLICIRGQWFEIEHVTAESVGESTRPVEMIAGSDVHKLFIKRRASGFREAAEEGILQMFLMYAIASEFPTFVRFELGDDRLTEVDPRDLPMLMAKLRNEEFTIIAEMLGGTAR